jgi:hypothetical protein
MASKEELLRLASKYVEHRVDLDELYTYVMDGEPWESGPDDRSADLELVYAIELACFEHFDGDRDDESVREIVAEELVRLAEARPRA